MTKSLTDVVMQDDITLLKDVIQKTNPKKSELQYALYYSCKHGKLNCAKYLIEEQKISPHLNVDNLMDNGPIFKYAAESGNLDLVKYLLENHQVDIESQGQYPGTKDTALLRAASHGHVDVVKYLLAHHANPNIQVSYASVLTKGIKSKNYAVVEALLEGEARVTREDLYYAVKEGNLTILKLLVAHGGTFTKQYTEPFTVVAAESGSVEILKYLENEHHLSVFDADPSLSWKDIKHTILRAAAESGNVAMMRYLVQTHHLDIQGYVTQENNGKYAYEHDAYGTILGRAVAKNMELVRYLFEDLKLVPPHAALKMLTKEAQSAGSRMNAYLSSHLTESKEDKQFLQTIYENEIPELDTATLYKLHHCKLVKKGHYESYSTEVYNEIEKRMLTDEQIIQAAAESKEAAAHMLTYYCSYQFDKDFSKLKLLLTQGYDVNTKESNGNSLAHVAAYSGGCNILKFLLEHGADIDQPNDKGITLINIFGTQLGSDPSALLNKPSLPYTNSLKQACSNQYDESLIPILKYSKGEIGSASPQELLELAASHGKLLDLLSYVNDSVFQEMKVIILAPDFRNRHNLTLDRVNDLIKKSQMSHNDESLEARQLLNDSYKKLIGLADFMKFFYYGGDKVSVVGKNEQNKQSFKRS